MHYHLEVVIPPTDNIQKSIEEVLWRFNENNDDGYDQFFDWFVIGGRWSGEKIMCGLDKDKLDKFNQILQDRKVTISNVISGKQALSPSSQIYMVDELWRDMFPESKLDSCPFFDHFTPKFNPDIVTLADVPKGLTSERVIFAKYSYDSDKKVVPEFMLTREFWNGCAHQSTDWDGSFESALTRYRKSLEGYKVEYLNEIEAKDDWLVVTVDYHS